MKTYNSKIVCIKLLIVLLILAGVFGCKRDKTPTGGNYYTEHKISILSILGNYIVPSLNL